jgi:hypothetical protein
MAGSCDTQYLTFSLVKLKRLYLRVRRRCKGNTKTEFKKIGCSGVYRIHLTEGRILRRSVMNTTICGSVVLRFCKRREILY